MRQLLLSLEVVGALVLLLLLALVIVLVRRRTLAARLGTFDCSVRPGGTSGRWSLGVARYEVDRLDWYRTFSLSPRPSRSYARGALDVSQRREPVGQELLTIQPGAIIVACRYQQDELELAMSRDAYTGFASWLESAPPGQNVSTV